MEDKKLNLNRPILSVRQKDYCPVNTSEMHSGPLRNPGSVPFVWEQIPGRPKDDKKPQKNPTVPKLPPTRVSKQDLDITTQVSTDKRHKTTQIKEKSKQVVNRESKKPQITYGPNFLQFNEPDDDHDDDDDHGNMSYNKVCGLLPHFLKGSSFGLLNPVPGLSARTKLTKLPQPQPQAAENEPKSLVKKKPVLNKKPDFKISNLNPLFVPISEDKDEKKGLISFKELLAYDNEEETAVEKTLYVDTIHKLEQNDAGCIFGISPDEMKQGKEMITETGNPMVDQKVKVSGLELPALPKSPSDSWLSRTLTASNPKYASNTTQKLDKNVQSRCPQGLLAPIPEN